MNVFRKKDEDVSIEEMDESDKSEDDINLMG